MWAETDSRIQNVYIDFFGGSNIVSVNYDTLLEYPYSAVMLGSGIHKVDIIIPMYIHYD